MTLADPQFHQTAERTIIEHVKALIASPNFRVDTTAGLKATSAYTCEVKQDDAAIDLKRAMVDANKPDRELQGQMPTGQTLTVTLSTTKWLIFKAVVGVVRVVCRSPVKGLLGGGAIEPMTASEVQSIIAAQKGDGSVPMTVIVASTSGFAPAGRDCVDRRTDRTVLLVEPNAAGGWNAYGPPTLKATVDQLNPEGEADRKARVAEQIDAAERELAGGGVSADKIAARTQLPLQWVEAELKQHAKSHAGLVAKRLDGHVVLFREGSLPAAVGSRAGGNSMPFIDSVKSLFSRKGETEKKISLLSERRAALSQRRDAAHEAMASLEQGESRLKNEFQSATSETTRKRLTSQLLQARKELSRRQQLLSVVHQQIDVISTHLHALELTQQGKAAEMPDGVELAKDAEAAEHVLAQLQADRELADTLLPSDGPSLTDEEQALYDELSAEMTPAQSADVPSGQAIPQATSPQPVKAADPAAPRAREEAT